MMCCTSYQTYVSSYYTISLTDQMRQIFNALMFGDEQTRIIAHIITHHHVLRYISHMYPIIDLYDQINRSKRRTSRALLFGDEQTRTIAIHYHISYCAAAHITDRCSLFY